MALRVYLDEDIFDAETVRLMGMAFEVALASLGPTLGHSDPVRELVARKITEGDPEPSTEARARFPEAGSGRSERAAGKTRARQPRRPS